MPLAKNEKNMEILNVRNVSKQYTNHLALDDVSLSVPEGSIYGLLGPNGAGKTTLIRIINHITAPDSGEVLFMGKRLCSDDVYKIGYLPEERGLYKKMKVGEQALYFARLKGLSKRDAVERLKYWFSKFGIEEWWNKKVEDLSKGMAQKVQFIITVLHKPKLLIFDEPFSGFDPINANMLKDEILNMKKEGATIIFSTHNMSSVEEICDHISLIHRSKNILSGEVSDIKQRYASNMYNLTFGGEREQLELSIPGVDLSFRDEKGVNSATLKISSSDQVREILAKINSSVDIYSFNKVMPSMNDIFINAVEGKLEL